MKVHNDWIVRRFSAVPDSAECVVRSLGGMEVTCYTGSVADKAKIGPALEGLEEINRAFPFPAKVFLYCTDSNDSVGILRQQSAGARLWEAHIGLGKTSNTHVTVAVGEDGEFYEQQGLTYGGPADGASWRICADVVWEGTQGGEDAKNAARVKAATIHEAGHILWQMSGNGYYEEFQDNNEFVEPGRLASDTSSTVSFGARMNLNEFVAEYFSGYWSGLRFSETASELFALIGGPFPDSFTLRAEITAGLAAKTM